VLKTMGATAVSMLILLEFPGAALVAAAFLGQTPPLLALPAALLLLAGLAIVIRAGSRGTVPAVPVD
jgi:drug/metabolite transporter (DMT)-like permease